MDYTSDLDGFRSHGGNCKRASEENGGGSDDGMEVVCMS